LSEAQRKNVEKMSDVRLVSVLTRAGFTADKLEGMDRPARMAAVAEITLSGVKVETAAAEMHAVGSGYDVELERMKFEWMRQKWEAERLERAAERTRLEEKEEAEKREREAERKWREEKEVRDREHEKRMMELRLAELDERKRRDAKEEAERKSATAIAKRMGDAMRNSTFRMGNNPIDLIALFEHLEEQFRIYEVPDDMKVQLMRPFLNEKANVLLSRLDTKKASDYTAVKEYLTHQFELCPRYYLSQFNSTPRRNDETCISYVSRPKVLLQYYVTSRHVSTYDLLFSLIVSDRVKGILPVDALRYVLSVEANKPNGWLEADELAVVIDNYQANFSKGKPVAAAVGFSRPPFGSNSFRGQDSNKNSAPPSHESLRSSAPMTEPIGNLTVHLIGAVGFALLNSI
jgi:hypothetical protein